MELLFSLLSSVRCLDIKSSNLSPWIEHIKKIGHCLREIALHDLGIESSTILTITKYCPYLEKLCVITMLERADSNILQIIASNCPNLRNITLWPDYLSSALAAVDLAAFSEKCP